MVIGAGGNRGMAVIAKRDQPIASLKDLKGHTVGILPGTTQEVFILETAPRRRPVDQGHQSGARVVR
ncbi:MAG: ABC transporter substrate-binding protein [Pseudomonadota bacterium]